MPTLIFFNSVIFAAAKVKDESDFFKIEIMELNALTAISAVDGRYRKQVQHLDEYFSEYA